MSNNDNNQQNNPLYQQARRAAQQQVNNVDPLAANPPNPYPEGSPAAQMCSTLSFDVTG